MLLPRPNNLIIITMLFQRKTSSNLCFFSIAWGFKKTLVMVDQKEDGESERLKQENEMTRWWTCKHPTWSASFESRDTIPVSYAPGWHRGNGKRKSSVLEVWGQWPSCKRGGLGVQAVQFGTFVPPTHLLTIHPLPFPLKHDSNSLMVQIFFYIIILWDSIQPLMT